MTSFVMLGVRRLAACEFSRIGASRGAVALVAGGRPVHGQETMQPHSWVWRPGQRDVVHQDSRAPDDDGHRTDEDRDSAKRPDWTAHIDAQQDERDRAEHNLRGKAFGPRHQETLQWRK